MDVTDAMVEAAITQAYHDAASTMDGSWMPPASAKVLDYANDPDGLRAADNAAHAINAAAMRRILEAALRDA